MSRSASETNQPKRKRGRGGSTAADRKAEQEAKLRAAMEALIGATVEKHMMEIPTQYLQ